MNTRIPQGIIHYSRGEPFQSLTGVSQETCSRVVQTLNETNAWGLSRFQDPDYLNRRRTIEAKLRDEFTSLGGRPQLKNPIYFFLGPSKPFGSHPANQGYEISLDDVLEHEISFTYGDSLLAFDPEYRSQSGVQYQHPQCGRIFLKSDLPLLFENNLHENPEALHIEVQVWTDPRLKSFRKIEG